MAEPWQPGTDRVDSITLLTLEEKATSVDESIQAVRQQRASNLPDTIAASTRGPPQ